MKPTTMLSFLIVLLTTFQMLLAANNPPPPPPPTPDSHKLVFEWPNTFCLDPPSPCQLHPQYFTLHGLWPQVRGRSITGCPGPVMDDKILVANKADLTKYWPDLTHSGFDESKGFWTYEWEKHGRCSGMPPADYLTLVFGAVKKYDVLKILADNGISPGDPNGHTAEQFRQAILTGTKLSTEIECEEKNKQQYLSQIYFCLTPQGQFKSCPIRYACANRPVFMPLPPPIDQSLARDGSF